MRSWAGTSSQRAWCRSWQTCSAVGWLAACQCTASGQWFAAHTTSHPAIAAPVENPPAPANRSIAFMAFLHPFSAQNTYAGRHHGFCGCVVHQLGLVLMARPLFAFLDGGIDHHAEHDGN